MLRFYWIFLVFLCWFTTLELFGVPVRVGILFFMVLFGIFTASRNAEAAASHLFRNPFFVGGVALFLYGIGLSVWMGVPLETIVHISTRYIIQPLLLLFLLIFLIRKYGSYRIIIPYIVVTTVSCVVAIAQGIGVDFAWNLRGDIGKIIEEDAGIAYFYVERVRAMGLAFNPVQMGYQALVGICLLFVIRQRIRIVFFVLLMALYFAAIIATGLRSAFIGGVVFLVLFGIFFWARGNVFRLFSLIAIGAIAVAASSILLETPKVRVVDFQGSSAVSRFALTYYGAQLFKDNPFGYGFGFDTRKASDAYRSKLKKMEKSAVTAEAALHNSVLYLGLVYGLPGFAVLIYIYGTVRYKDRLQWIGLNAFLINSFFHNSGLFVGDLLVMYFAALLPGSVGSAGKKQIINKEKDNGI